MLSLRIAASLGAGLVILCGSKATADQSVPTKKSQTIGRYEVQDFTVGEGDSIETKRGGAIKFSDVEDNSVAVTRQFKGSWAVGVYSIGNHETLEIVDVDPTKKTARVRLRTKTWLYPWETSFERRGRDTLFICEGQPPKLHFRTPAIKSN